VSISGKGNRKESDYRKTEKEEQKSEKQRSEYISGYLLAVFPIISF
jgi:hypothetical protein